jgi:hypothetical protein
MNARRLTLAVVTALCASACLLAAAGTPADALVIHDYLPALSGKLSEPIPSQGPHGEAIAQPGPLGMVPSGMTVDSGHLWVAESDARGESRIDEYDASTGAFMAQIPHSPGGEQGLAVGHAAGETQIYAGHLSASGGSVIVYGEGGAVKATWTGAATPAGSFGELVNVAADNSTDPLDPAKGYVYVAAPSQGVIDVFRPEADGAEHYVGQLTGTSPSEPFAFPYHFAVDDANGDVVVVDARAEVLDVFEPTGLGEYTFVRSITETSHGRLSSLYNIAIDSVNGEIYVSEGFNPMAIDEFDIEGAYLGHTTGADTPPGRINDAYSFAVDSELHQLYVGETGHAETGPGEYAPPAIDVFGPDVVLPDVASAPASNLTPTGATFNGTVNPENAGAATCRFEWGTSPAFGKVAACEPEGVADGASPVPVRASVSGLQPDTTYYYRLQASNANGTNPGDPSQTQQLRTTGPGIHEESVTDVASTSVTFNATIDPNGAPTTYYFQYGPSTAYGSETPAAPGEAIGSGEADVEVTPHHVQGLQTASTYHYRVVALSELKSGQVETFYGPDEAFTTETAASSELPDGRQWEMVSPPNKRGARLYPIEEMGIVQAAADGDAVTYLADNPSETEPQGFSNEMQYLSTRGPDGWQTRNIALPHSSATGPSVGDGQEYRLFSPNLSQAIVQPFGNFEPGLSPEASEPTAFLRTLEGACGSTCYRPLVTGRLGYANVPAGTVFGDESEGRCPGLFCGPAFVQATPDLRHVLLRSQVPLMTGAGEGQMYEWSDGALTHVTVMPDGSSAPGPDLATGVWAISNDGSRVIWQTINRTELYMRDTLSGQTVQLDAAEPACVVEGKCGSGQGQLHVASADGSKVFFTDSHRLTKGVSPAGDGLYECAIAEIGGELQCKLSNLASEVLGVVGGSEDGSYLYFVAQSALAQGAVAGESNMYVRHDGLTKLVAVLSPEDLHDWNTEGSEAAGRVSPDGNRVEFMSQRSLTGYDNRDAVSGQPDAEVYLYDANAGRVVCASCNPTGARPLGAEYRKLEPGAGGLAGGPPGLWNSNGWIAANVPGWVQYEIGPEGAAEQPRYLSNSGRLFFDSGDALVPQDVNGTEDVYEYEPPGVGSCTSVSTTFNERSDGCVDLISSGTSAEESSFLEASENGGDVFFLTFSKLQPQDYDSSLDVYDAHECTSVAPCFPTPSPQPPACTTADACRVAPTPQPTIFGAPSSATFSGAGNVTPETHGAARNKSLTRAQKLARALRACKHKPKKRRAACAKRAERRYAASGPRKATKPRGASKKKGDR